MPGLFYYIGANNDDLIAKLNQSRDAIVNGSRKVQEAGMSMEDIFKKTATALGVVGGIDFAKNIISQVVEVRGQFQQLEVAFTTMLNGSEQAANTLMQQLVKTAAVTPFNLTDVAQGAKQLLAFGIEAKDVNKTLVDLGNIASGLSIPLNDLVYLYGTTMVQGRMFTMDLRQFQSRGVNLPEELAKQFGVAKEKIAGFVTEGKVTSKEFSKAIASMSEDGGKFANLMEKQSDTITGKISNIEDKIKTMYDNIGMNNEGVINSSLSGITSVVENYKEIGSILIELVAVYGTYRAVLMVVTALESEAAIVQRAAAISSVELSFAQVRGAAATRLVSNTWKEMTASMSVNPIVAASLAITALAFVIYKYATYEDEFDKANKRAQEAIDGVNKEVVKEQDKLDALNNKLQQSKKGTDGWKSAKDAVIKQYGQYDSKLSQEINRTGDLSSSYDKLTTAIRKSIAARRLKQFYDTNTDSTQDDIEKQQESIQNYMVGEFGKKYYNQHVNEINSYINGSGKLSKELTDRINSNDLKSMFWAPLQNARNSKLAGDMALSNYENMSGISKSEANEILYGIAPIKKDNKPAEKMDKEYYETLKKNLQGELDSLANTKANVTKRNKLISDINKAQEAIDWYSASKSNSSAKKAETDAKREETALEKKNESIAKQLDLAKKAKDTQKEISNTNTDKAFELRQSDIDRNTDDFDKQIQQIKLNYDKLVEENKRAKDAAVKKLQDSANEVFEAQNPDWRKKNPKGRPVVTEADLSVEQNKLFDDSATSASKTYEFEIQKLYKSINDKYRNFDQKRADINKLYSDDRNSIDKEYQSGKSGMSSSDYAKAIEENKRQQAEAIRQIGDEEYTALQKDGGAIAELFEDTSYKSVSEIQHIIDKIQVLLAYIKGVKDENGTSTITNKDGSKNVITAEQLGNAGFTPSQAGVIGQDPTKLKNTTTQVMKLKEEVDKSNPFKALANAVKLFSSNQDESSNKSLSFEGKMKKLGSAVSSTATLFGNLSGQLSEMFSAAGNTEMADLTKGVGDVMTSVSNIGQGFAQGGLVGGIAATASEAISWATKAFAAEARYKAAIKEIQQDILSQQREYNLELMKTSLEYEKGSTIFGTDNYAKAINAVSVMKTAYADLNKELKNINDIQIVTGFHKTGLFGWGSGEYEYSSILKVYPELINKSGEFNDTLAESIINTRSMSEENKAALQSMIDYAKEAEEAWKQVDSYLTDIFGELGNNLTSVLKTAFESGTDYAYAFGDSISDMLEKLAEQMIFSVYFSNEFETASNQVKEIMKNTGLSADQQMQKYVLVMDDLMTSVSANVPAAETLMQQWKDLASKYGFDIFDNKKNSTSSSNTATAVTATQDSVDVLNGKGTALIMINEQSRNYIMMVYNTLLLMQTSASNDFAKMEEIRGLVYLSTSYLEDIKKSAAYLPEMSEKLDKIIDNTDALTSR